MSTGAPLDLDLPKELAGMEYWTSLFVQVRDCLDDRFLFFLLRVCSSVPYFSIEF